MPLEVTVRNGKLTKELKSHVERRLAFALGRFGERIGRISVCLEDLNGPKGGVDQHCRIEANLIPSGIVMAEATDVQPALAVNRATEKLARRVRNEFDRKRTTRKRAATSESL